MQSNLIYYARTIFRKEIINEEVVYSIIKKIIYAREGSGVVSPKRALKGGARAGGTFGNIGCELLALFRNKI